MNNTTISQTYSNLAASLNDNLLFSKNIFIVSIIGAGKSSCQTICSAACAPIKFVAKLFEKSSYTNASFFSLTSSRVSLKKLEQQVKAHAGKIAILTSFLTLGVAALALFYFSQENPPPPPPPAGFPYGAIALGVGGLVVGLPFVVKTLFVCEKKVRNEIFQQFPSLSFDDQMNSLFYWFFSMQCFVGDKEKIDQAKRAITSVTIPDANAYKAELNKLRETKHMPFVQILVNNAEFEDRFANPQDKQKLLRVLQSIYVLAGSTIPLYD